MPSCLSIYKGSGDENQGPLVDVASTLPAEPSSHPPLTQFLKHAPDVEP